MNELIVDNFAGGGGASTGIEAALGRCVDVAINHSEIALTTHQANHAGTHHICEDVFAVKPESVTKGRQVGLCWFSPDCKHFSKAKGGKPVSKKTRGLAWVAVRWAKEVRPRVIILENVEEFQGWGPLVQRERKKPSFEMWRKTYKWRHIEGLKELRQSYKELVTDSEDFEWVPDPARRGLTFKRFVGTLRNLGYVIEWRELVAADYGAPTTRKRLFLIARCDGRPIVWPEPTHAKKPSDADMFEGRKLPWRTAAECIDWSLPCPSIFERKKPLAENTLRRIAEGLRRFVIEAAEPFIVPVTHAGGEGRVYGLDEPLKTVTGAQRGEMALVTPAIMRNNHGEKPCDSVDEPMRTATTQGNKFMLVAPTVVGVGGRAGQSRPRGVDEPLGTATAKYDKGLATAFLERQFGQSKGSDIEQPSPAITGTNHDALVVPHLVGVGGPSYSGKPKAVNEPMGAQTTENHRGLVSAFLNKYRGASSGSAATDPVPTVTAGAGSERPAGAAHALGVTQVALVNKHYGGVVGHEVEKPLGAVTGIDHHSLTTANLLKFRGTSTVAGVEEPMPTLTAQGTHIAEVRAFLVSYYGQGVGQSLKAPARTITTKDRLGLVTIHGVDYQIVDIGLRMLTPRELARAQGFPEGYILPATKSAAVALIGNSVCPPLAEAIVRANCGDMARMEAVA